MDDLAGGLLLMVVFTIIQVVIAEVNIAGRDHWIAGVLFAFIIDYSVRRKLLGAVR
ncbi:hypothetical protein INP83_12625 [Mucilaginibacter sp. 21P]|uniref:hypothetical protein n=1 Tax=Mucilaginibacter sp. 21P TaxID=2778902 RepID=UPI001C57781A|nr:hypothetical protein [Mucilaginibacter sp. 21P]QXV63945.1 hypothetical protein INP83_12625 [Mucilaginibacter sp. 21P]